MDDNLNKLYQKRLQDRRLNNFKDKKTNNYFNVSNEFKNNLLSKNKITETENANINKFDAKVAVYKDNKDRYFKNLGKNSFLDFNDNNFNNFSNFNMNNNFKSNIKFNFDTKPNLDKNINVDSKKKEINKKQKDKNKYKNDEYYILNNLKKLGILND